MVAGAVPARRRLLLTGALASPMIWTRRAAAAQQLVVRTPGGVFDAVVAVVTYYRADRHHLDRDVFPVSPIAFGRQCAVDRRVQCGDCAAGGAKTRAFGVTPMEDGLRVAGTVEIYGLDAPPNEARAKVLVQHARRMFPALTGEQVRYWMGFRPSTPDSLPVVGPVSGRPGLHLLFGHGHFGMTGGPPSGRLVVRQIMGQPLGIDPAPYSVQRFGGRT